MAVFLATKGRVQVFAIAEHQPVDERGKLPDGLLILHCRRGQRNPTVLFDALVIFLLQEMRSVLAVDAPDRTVVDS